MVQQKQVFVAASAAFTIGGLAWLALKLTRLRSERLEDDALFASPPAGAYANAATSSSGVVAAVAQESLPSSPYVADEIRKEAMNSVKAVVLSLGGHVEEVEGDEKGDDGSDGSYSTDLELELNIGNEMERILRSQIMDLTEKVFAADGSILQSAADAPAVTAGKKKTKGSAKKKAPLVELLELTHQYLDLSHERLNVQRKLQAQQALAPIGARRFGVKEAPMPSALQARPGGYGDIEESDEDEEGPMDWGRAPRHQQYGYGDDDGEDDTPWKMHGDEDEEDWEDEEDDMWDEEDEEAYEEGDDDDDDDFEAAWLRANGQPSVENAADDAERAEFEKFLIERCMSKELAQLLVQSQAAALMPETKQDAGEEGEWESESEDGDRPKKHVRGGKKTSAAVNAKQSKSKRQRGGNAAAQQARYENGEWVDF
jgi:hypothetical protein